MPIQRTDLPFKCFLCQYTFKSWKSLYGHIFNKHPEHPRDEVRNYIQNIKEQTNPKGYKSQLEETKHDIIDITPQELQTPLNVAAPQMSVEATPNNQVLPPTPQSTFTIPTNRAVTLDGRDLHMSELLISAGYAKDFNSLMKQNIRLAFSLLNLGSLAGNKNNVTEEPMMKEETVAERIEKIKKRRLDDIELETLEKEVNKGGKKNMETSDMLMMMMLMGNKNNSNNDLLVQILPTLLQNSGKDSTKEIIEVAKLLVPQKQNDSNTQLEFMKILMDQQKQGGSIQDVLKAMQEKDKMSYQQQLEIQKSRESQNTQMLRLEMENIKNKLEHASNGGQMDLDKIKEVISSVKSINEELGNTEKKLTPVDYINSISGAVAPVLTELVRNQKNKSGNENQQRGSERFQQMENQSFQQGQMLTEEQLIQMHRQNEQMQNNAIAQSDNRKSQFEIEKTNKPETKRNQRKYDSIIPDTGVELPTKKQSETDYIG